MGKVVLHRLEREREHAALDGREHPLTLVCKALEVDIRVNDALRTLALGRRHCAVLGNEVVTREHKILRELTETGICVPVRTQQSAGLLTNKVAAVAPPCR